MLTETETPRIYYELVKIIFVSICLNIKNIEERNTEDKFFNQVHVPNTGSPMLQNLFLAQSMRTSIMLRFQNKIHVNASVFHCQIT